MSWPEGNLWPALAGALAVGCCLGLPLLVAAGAGAALVVLAGIGAAAVALVAAALILVMIRRRAGAGPRSRVDSQAADSAGGSLASLDRRSG